MSDPSEIVAKLADVQRQLLDLPADAFEEKYKLLNQQDLLREEAAGYAGLVDSDRSDEELLAELAAQRSQLAAVESQRIDLVMQAGGGGAMSGEMGNLGGVKINKGIDDAHGLPKIKARIGVIKGMLRDRGVEFPEAT